MSRILVKRMGAATLTILTVVLTLGLGGPTAAQDSSAVPELTMLRSAVQTKNAEIEALKVEVERLCQENKQLKEALAKAGVKIEGSAVGGAVSSRPAVARIAVTTQASPNKLISSPTNNAGPVVSPAQLVVGMTFQQAQKALGPRSIWKQKGAGEGGSELYEVEVVRFIPMLPGLNGWMRVDRLLVVLENGTVKSFVSNLEDR